MHWLRKAITVYVDQSICANPRIEKRTDPNGNEYYAVRVLVIGTAGVGKTSLVNRYVEGIPPNDSFVSTIGTEFKMKIIKIRDKTVKVRTIDQF